MNIRNPFLRVGLFVATFLTGFVLTLTIRVALGVKSSDAIPVALVPEKAYTKAAPITVKLQWGGFYAIREGKLTKVFRMLDINQDEVHVQTYGETFRDMPTIHDVTFLISDKEHEVWKATKFLEARPVYIGGKSLHANDLERFGRYLISTGTRGTELARHLDRVIRLSRDTPLETKLSDAGGVIEFDQAGI